MKLRCIVPVFVFLHFSINICGGSQKERREGSLLDADAPTSFPTAFYEQDVIGKEWWYIVQATIMFAGDLKSNPNEAADYALTFTLEDRLRQKPEVSAEVLEVNILRTPM